MTIPKPKETRALVSFVRKDLGCGCPNEVFSVVQIKKDPQVFRDLPVDYMITIGDRLLIGICLSENLHNGIGEGIVTSLSVGKRLRDAAGFNRFRLVITSNDADRIQEKIKRQFQALSGLDERIHLHVVGPAVIPAFLTGNSD